MKVYEGLKSILPKIVTTSHMYELQTSMSLWGFFLYYQDTSGSEAHTFSKQVVFFFFFMPMVSEVSWNKKQQEHNSLEDLP